MLEKQQPWRAVSRTISKFPRCRAYLKAMRIKTDDPSQTDYWLAVTLSDGFSDARLAEMGVDFDTMKGSTLLTAFEEILSAKAKPKGRAKKQRSGGPAATVDKITAAVSEAEIIAGMTYPHYSQALYYSLKECSDRS